VGLAELHSFTEGLCYVKKQENVWIPAKTYIDIDELEI
jgi:hypothetical protein